MTADNVPKGSAKIDVTTAKSQLDLVLGFFPRIDAKFSVVLGLDLGMLGVLASKIPSSWAAVPGATWCVVAGFATALIFSLVQLYRGSYPNVKGGEGSVIFFGHIANQTEHKFIEAFKELTNERLADELLGQAWRNSKILQEKISALRWAYIFMAVAIVPWVVALARFAAAAP
ncbi:Pycsar system effector family protein [Dyella sp.]|uniref:Pycsar system effector family protein n=1 Tax=Dyella sp. TaxID=1869338 RepID=UPI003F807190